MKKLFRVVMAIEVDTDDLSYEHLGTEGGIHSEIQTWMDDLRVKASVAVSDVTHELEGDGDYN